jgi:hypothetical protein
MRDANETLNDPTPTVFMEPYLPDWKSRLILSALSLILAAGLACPPGSSAADGAFADFGEKVQPILEEHCSKCHGNGIKKGGVTLDGLDSTPARLHDHALWLSVLKNLRAGIMPPRGEPKPTDQDLRAIEDWIRYAAFGIDSKDPDPGRITVRRLNRVEYRNTIRELMGVDFDTESEFPADDSGHGFDNIGDVLTMSPLLLEKYVGAARSVVAQSVPTAPLAVTEKTIPGRSFLRPGSKDGGAAVKGPLVLPYYDPATAIATYRAEHPGRYKLVLDLTATEKYVDGVFDYNKCRLIFKVDGEELYRREFVRQEGRTSRPEFDRQWQPGPHELTVEIQPLNPGPRVRSLAIRINAAVVRGPLEEKYWTPPPSYTRFFPGKVPAAGAERSRYTRELLGSFATRAFRRPVEEAWLDRIAGLAERECGREGQTYEAGVAKAMAVILASPRFLFRVEGMEPESSGRYPLVNEYALASRLSYFLWSSMPDDELFRLASEHRLRENLRAQFDRMLADPRGREFVTHFVGQWLQVRDVDSVLINAAAIMSRDQAPDPAADKRRARFRELNRKPPEKLTEQEKAELKQVRAAFFGSFRRFREFELTGELRRAMRRETEMLFEHVVKGNRSLVELIDCDYTFLNEKLAKHYGIDGVKGEEMRLVKLPPESPRGGVLTQGTVLTVTSNPDRTSPVKRGLFVLENILGTPPPPPPPDIPPLEDAAKKLLGKTPTLRESLAVHRAMSSCAGCHNRMDPLGLAMENYNALGRWRDKERGQPIDAGGTLITGESFTGMKELKKVLAGEHRREFYRCLSEKMLTYALGRGLDYRDTLAVDQLVDRLEKEDGRASSLLLGIIESTPFQRRQRPAGDQTAERPDRQTQPRTELPNGGAAHGIKS